MVLATEIHNDPDGTVVVRRAIGAEDAARLRSIGERLDAIGHPGVVQVRSTSGSDDDWELRLDYAGRPIDLLGALSAEQVAGLAAGVAATLADLHAVGVVHGRVDLSHVLVGPEGRPILCGFDGGEHEAGPADDVAAVGTIIVALLDHARSGPDLEPIPDRRWSRLGRRGTPRWDGWARRSLLLLADQACAEPASRRPSAQRLAASITEAVPGAVVPSVLLPEPRSQDPFAALRPTPEELARRPRWPVLAVSVAIVSIVGVGAVGLTGRVRAAPPSLPVETLAPPTHVPTTEAPTTSTSVTPPVAEVPVVAIAGREYRVGRAGDRVAVGDWDGDGEPTPAALRPSTGEVFVFPRWTDDAPVTVTATSTVAGAVELIAVPAEGHDDLVARLGDGTRVVIEVAA